MANSQASATCAGVAGGDAGDDRIAADLIVLRPRPAQGTKRNERDATGGALVEERSRGPIREVEGVLDAHDVGDFKRPQQLSVGHVADPDSFDQAVVRAATKAPSWSTNR